MIIHDKIQNSLGEVVLRKKLKTVNRFKETYNLETATSIGVIFPISENLSRAEIKDFLDYLAKNKTRLYVLGFYDGKEIPGEYKKEDKLNIITRKDFNWFHKPLNPVIKEFIHKELDILIDLCMEKFLPVDFILSLSRAHFKVGRYRECNEYHDMMIEIKNGQGFSFFISQIKHYLTIINHKN